MASTRKFFLSVAGAAAALFVSVSAPAQPVLTGPAGDGFYIPPPLPGDKRGSIVWSRPLGGTMALPSAARNILTIYRSVDEKGGIVPVSGTIAIPQGEAPRGGWPVITWTHGTTGLAPICAPSRDTANGPEHDYIETIRNLLDGFVKKGYAVVATDYAGLGVARFHPYLQGVPTGRNALDMMRAALAIEPKIGTRYAVMGHSQGGQVDLFAASLGPSYAPEFKLVGNVAFAPGSHIAGRLDAVMKSAKTDLSLPYVLYALQSYATTDRGIDLRKILTPEALSHLPDLHVQCMTYALSKTYWATAIAKDQFVAKPAVAPFRKAAERNEPGRLRIAAPTLIVQGTKDITVFPEGTDKLARQLCANGNVVSYKPVAGADHDGSMSFGGGLAQDFIDARFAGRKAENDCKALPKAGE
jgi:pimeloyl-ACP methyl ester carboxylesterase